MVESEGQKGHYRGQWDEAEMKRLDDMHNNVKAFMGGNILAAVGNPKSFLEVGGGSGIWAKEVAESYPDAAVTVIDIAQVPVERLPSNCKFQKMDITKEFPFAPDSFDVVHSRYVIMHLRHAEDVLQKLITTIKPGGWLLLEESVGLPSTADGGPLPPAMKALFGFWEGLIKQGGADPRTGTRLEGRLNASNAFSEIECTKFIVPMTPWTEDPKLNILGEGINCGVTAGLTTVFKHLGDEPRAKGLLEPALEEMHDPRYKIGFPTFFIWARKKE